MFVKVANTHARGDTLGGWHIWARVEKLEIKRRSFWSTELRSRSDRTLAKWVRSLWQSGTVSVCWSDGGVRRWSDAQHLGPVNTDVSWHSAVKQGERSKCWGVSDLEKPSRGAYWKWPDATLVEHPVGPRSIRSTARWLGRVREWMPRWRIRSLHAASSRHLTLEHD
jgi:hypothetical protein